MAAPAALAGAGGVFTDISTSPDGPSIGGRVEALALGPDGTFTVGGSFSSAGGRPAANVARWDGTAWRALGSGLGQTSPFTVVSDLVTGPDGSLYAGGSFKTAGGATIHGVARWDGVAWQSVGDAAVDTLVQTVEALAIGPDGSLYAGGSFLTAAGTRMTGVGRWTGTAWQILGEGGPLTGRALALAVGPDGTVYASGSLRLGGARVAGARWDGTTWSTLGAGTTNDSVQSLLIAPDGSLVAGGLFTLINGVAANGVARWNGAAWRPLGSGIDGYVYALATLPDGRLVAGGDFRTAGGVAAGGVAVWDGVSWQPVGEGTDGRLAAVAVGPDGRLTVAGVFSLAGDTAANAVARWDGAAWEGFGNTTGTINAVAAGPDGTVYVGGYLSTVAGVVVRGAARWDGTTWTPLGNGPGASVYAMDTAPDGTLYVGTTDNRVLRWDGTAWSPVGSGLPTGLNELYSITVGVDGLVYIGGRRYDNGQGIRRWNGTAWEPVGAGLLGNVWSLAVGPDGRLYAGGEFIRRTATDPSASVARWDGTSWTVIGAVTPGSEVPVNALAFAPNGDLYAGGYFETMNGVPLRNLARWDGTAWFEVGGSAGVPGEVYSLLPTADGGLYVGGAYEALARWDGTAWTSAGPFTPFGGYVFGIARDPNGDLLVGGRFQRAGGVASPNVVLYTPAPVASEPVASPAEVLALSVAPNPARGTAMVTVTHAAGPVTVEILDALGRRVAQVAPSAGAETHTLALPVGHLAPGAYVVRVVAGGEAASRPLVVVR
jgi:hypothetical protein